MGSFSIWHWTTLFLIVLWWLPVVLVALSLRGSGLERAIWALVCALTSWVGYIGFRLSVRDSQ